MKSLVLPLILVVLLLFPLVFIGEVVSLPINQEILALGAFKRSIVDDPLSVLSDWNSFDENPCGWSGVTCLKPQNRVVNLTLSNSSLKGFLAPEIGLLEFLQELVLSNNSFLGTIPKEIGLLKNLTVLDLSLNLFSGPIPAEITDLTSVTKMTPSYENQTGLCGLTSLKFADLSYNFFVGNISPCLKNLPRINFRGNCFHDK